MNHETPIERGDEGTGSARLEAFSDGVLAVIITIMVLELKPPATADLAALAARLPSFLTYVLSFTNIGIYWNSHHRLLQNTKQISSAAMWANLVLLFWLSLVPFFTAWVGDHYTSLWPTVGYGTNMLLAALSYTFLQIALVRVQGADSRLSTKLGSDFKGKMSLVLYVAGIGLAFVNPAFGDIFFLSVAIIWFIPDPRLK